MQTSALRSDHDTLRPSRRDAASENAPAPRLRDSPSNLKVRTGRPTQRHHRVWTNASVAIDDFQPDSILEIEIVVAREQFEGACIALAERPEDMRPAEHAGCAE